MRGLDRGRRAGELLELLVVEDQAVDGLDGPHERVVRDVDPQVHRVHRDEARVLALLADVELQVGLDVGQEEDVAVLGGRRELGLEVLEDVEVGAQRRALVEVVVVLARPEERLAARDVLDVVGDGAARAQDGELVGAEVVPDGADGAHLVEERRGEREVGGSSAEHAVARPRGGLDRIEGERSDDREAHSGAGGYRDSLARHARHPAAGVRRPRGPGARGARAARPGRRRGARPRVAVRKCSRSSNWPSSRNASTT